MITEWKCNECGKVNAPWVAECPGFHSIVYPVVVPVIVPNITYPLVPIYPTIPGTGTPEHQWPIIWSGTSSSIGV